MGFPRGNVPWAGFGAEPQYKSVGDTTKLRFITGTLYMRKGSGAGDDEIIQSVRDDNRKQ